MTADESEINHYLQESDNDEEWGESVRPTSRRRLDAVVSVRFNPHELELIRSAAPDGNVSNFIRSAALRATTNLKQGWSLSITLNGSSQRENGYVASFQDSPSATEAGMVLANWTPPTVQLGVAS